MSFKLTLAILVIAVNSTIAQGEEEIKLINWHVDAVKLADGDYDLHFTATVKPSWHIYSLYNRQPAPEPLIEFRFEGGELIELSDRIQEHGQLTTAFDPVFAQPLSWFEKSVLFVQRLKIKQPVKTIKGVVYFALSDRNECLPNEKFIFKVDLPD